MTSLLPPQKPELVPESKETEETKSQNKSQIRRMVFLKVSLPWKVVIAPDHLDQKGVFLHKAIILKLMEDISIRKSSREHGYFVAVTSLEEIGEGKIRESTGDVLFPVTFSCITLKPSKGEIMVGTVHKIFKHEVFLKCGPMENVFMSEKKMKDYNYVGGDDPIFLNEKHSRLEKDSKVCFKVLGLKWLEHDREFQILATLAGDFLATHLSVVLSLCLQEFWTCCT